MENGGGAWGGGGNIHFNIFLKVAGSIVLDNWTSFLTSGGSRMPKKGVLSAAKPPPPWAMTWTTDMIIDSTVILCSATPPILRMRINTDLLRLDALLQVQFSHQLVTASYVF